MSLSVTLGGVPPFTASGQCFFGMVEGQHLLVLTSLAPLSVVYL